MFIAISIATLVLAILFLVLHTDVQLAPSDSFKQTSWVGILFVAWTIWMITMLNVLNAL